MEINEKIANLPAGSGVYIFKDEHNTPIYIGKAKSLKKRVSSYFRPSRTNWKIDVLVPEITDIQYIITRTETQALLLEAELVHTHQPKFNVLLKDGQPFVYLMISQTSLPQLKLVRNKKEPGTYFGPFLYKGQARAVYHALLEHLKLYLCNKKIPHGCLQYHIGRCAGACRDDFDVAAYRERLDAAMRILRGESDQLYKDLQKRMRAHSHAREFEQAQKIAHLLAQLEAVLRIITLHFDVKKFKHQVFVALQQQKRPDQNVGHQLAQLLRLPHTPQTIDCFDVSHLQGHALVGSCVRFVCAVPDKNSCRKFNIRSVHEQNDYAALQEIVTRRYKDLTQLPDLVLIDGGKGQLHAVQKVLAGIPIIALAKREETVFCNAFPDGIKIDVNSADGRALIALRDYAHHFAITYQRMRLRAQFAKS